MLPNLFWLACALALVPWRLATASAPAHDAVTPPAYGVVATPAHDIVATPAHDVVATSAHDIVAALFPQYNGARVGHISVLGLRRSREAIVRWMLGAREGELFDAQSWQDGIERLYKTESIYDIHTAIEPGPDGALLITLTLRDKWTLFPYLDFQGGGGALSLSAGVFDSNLLGTFTEFYVGGGYLDHEYSYELGAYQKWFLQTTYSVGVAFTKKTAPITLQNRAGDTLQSFTWARARQALVVGKQNGERTYWELGFDAFRDSVRDPSPRTAGFVFAEKNQYRVSPALKLGKISHSDYLEQGHELRLGVSGANLFQTALEYHAVTVSWKHVIFLPDTRNVAYFVSLGAMNPAPLAYQFRLGGFDSVRGFGMNRTFGLDVARANLEYRSTLFTYRIPFWDLDRVVFQSCFFTDAGATWNSAGIDLVTGANTQKDTRTLYSAGVGLRAIFLHFASAIGRLDVAKALTPSEGYNVSFGIGQFF